MSTSLQRWAETSFSARDPVTEMEIRDLIHEASEAARDDYGVNSANEWAGGYRFPEEFVKSCWRVPST
jgi:hypothetical protein